MTDTPRLPPPTAAAHHRHPFTLRTGRWEAEHPHALRSDHIPGHPYTAEREPVLVYERTRWGPARLDRARRRLPTRTPTPDRDSHLIGDTYAAPAPALADQAPHPAHRPDPQHPWLFTPLPFTVAASVFAGLFAMTHGIPADVALPAMTPAPLLAEHLPSTLDAPAREHVRSVEDASACRYLQRLAALHTCLVQAAAVSDRHELRRSAQIGQHLLWDAADLLQTHHSPSASYELMARKRLMLQLAHQVAQILKHPPAQSATADADQARTPRPAATPMPATPGQPPGTPPPKGTLLMPQPDLAARTSDVYLLFAHEAYYPGPGTQEINTTVVAAGTLLHPRVLQPDGTRIHDLLTQGRQPREIIPLATLTHELGGGADWPAVGDWERVTADLVDLVQTQRCDALSLGLPEVARALICTGPDSQVRAFDAAAGEFTVYGPHERTEVLTEVGMFLTGIAAERPFWPGDGLLPPLSHSACARHGSGAER